MVKTDGWERSKVGISYPAGTPNFYEGLWETSISQSVELPAR